MSLEDRLSTLKGFQRTYLRGLAHGIKPVVLVGQQGVSDGIVQSVEEALQRHELIKLKFIDFKEKDRKTAMAAAIEEKTDCEMVGMIGHTGIFYRAHHDPEKRKIVLPKRKE
jgi:RNA-binding protein